MQLKRMWGTVLATAALATMLAPAAHASAEGRRNTTIILGGVAAYELLKGNTTAGILAGAATVGAYGRYRDAKNREEWYDSRYRQRAYREDFGYRPSYRDDRYRDYDRDDRRYRDNDRDDSRYDRANYRYRDDSRTRYFLDDRGRDRNCR
jgi:hypothetical protein